jgi:outer membrane cobalamin receptor
VKLEIITVTAEKRTETLQEVSSSIEVLHGSKLIDEGATPVADYANQILGLNLVNSGGPGAGADHSEIYHNRCRHRCAGRSVPGRCAVYTQCSER